MGCRSDITHDLISHNAPAPRRFFLIVKDDDLGIIQVFVVLEMESSTHLSRRRICHSFSLSEMSVMATSIPCFNINVIDSSQGLNERIFKLGDT